MKREPQGGNAQLVHTSSFSTCVSVGDLEKGNKLHACVLRNGFGTVFVMIIVILIYMKCKKYRWGLPNVWQND